MRSKKKEHRENRREGLINKNSEFSRAEGYEFPNSKIPAQWVKTDQLRSVCEISEQMDKKDSARPGRRGSVMLKIKNRNIFGFNINSGSWKEGYGAAPSEFLWKMPNLRLYT